jgi:hypothetical protein
MLINTNRIHYRPDGSSGNSFVTPKNLGAHDETLTVQSKKATILVMDTVATT